MNRKMHTPKVNLIIFDKMRASEQRTEGGEEEAVTEEGAYSFKQEL